MTQRQARQRQEKLVHTCRLRWSRRREGPAQSPIPRRLRGRRGGDRSVSDDAEAGLRRDQRNLACQLGSCSSTNVGDVVHQGHRVPQ
jgi:hypothetical protein